ncbi:hypothetical protein FZEAL_5695 [Fusarium zealandicum]|uniref:Aminodeoxychorismate lyase n=1 Tax=Fusarium zealandicum TaxID=1053134 RepID=A0A8H4XKC2_9HYPO|nr:hypothetical protein FZEAL_5695 [Fusarium zealandicum]
MGDDFSLFTSMRYDPKLEELKDQGLSGEGWNFDNKSPFYMLDFHRDRLLRAATYWNWQLVVERLSGADGLESLARLAAEAVGQSQEKPLRLRIIVPCDGEIKVEKFDTPEVPLDNLLPSQLPAPSTVLSDHSPKKTPNFALFVDQASTSRSEFTHFKTTKRAMYDSARKRAGIAPADLKEVLVVNRNSGAIMEGTITTPYFWRAGHWVTPPIPARFSLQDGSGGQDGTSRRWALER